jgi:hypothetical protein
MSALSLTRKTACHTGVPSRRERGVIPSVETVLLAEHLEGKRKCMVC